MVGELFTVSPINVARAAIRKVERVISAVAPIEILVRSHRAAADQGDPDGFSRAVLAP